MNQRIFIVDDDPFWTALLRQLLTDLGYTDIHSFENGKACLDNLHLNPEFVFLDYQMDDIDGLEVLAKIKDYFEEIRVIFCTAYEDLGVAMNALGEGSSEYLLKANVSKEEIEVILHKI